MQSVGAQRGAIGLAVAVQKQMPFGAHDLLVEITNIPPRIGNDDAGSQLTITGSLAIETFHQIIAVDIETTHRGVQFVDVHMIQHVALESQQAGITASVWGEELDEVILDRFALVIVHTSDHLQIAERSRSIVPTMQNGYLSGHHRSPVS